MRRASRPARAAAFLALAALAATPVAAQEETRVRAQVDRYEIGEGEDLRLVVEVSGPALDKVGLAKRERANPVELSGGEQQRLAIARAVVNRPALLVADEPTGNLDADSADEILELFAEFNRVGVTVILATHDARRIERYRPQLLVLDHGRLAA